MSETGRPSNLTLQRELEIELGCTTTEARSMDCFMLGALSVYCTDEMWDKALAMAREELTKERKKAAEYTDKRDSLKEAMVC